MDTAKKKFLNTDDDLLTYLRQRDLTWLSTYKKLLGVERDRARVDLIRRINASLSVGTAPADLYQAIDETLGTSSFRHLGEASTVSEPVELIVPSERPVERQSRNFEGPDEPAPAILTEHVHEKTSKFGKHSKTGAQRWRCKCGSSFYDHAPGYVDGRRKSSVEPDPTKYAADHIHDKTHKNGFDKQGHQRWRCGCGKCWAEHPEGYVDGRKKPRPKRAVDREPKNKHEKWVQKQRYAGNCTRCGKPAAPYSLCDDCREKQRNNSLQVPPETVLPSKITMELHETEIIAPAESVGEVVESLIQNVEEAKPSRRLENFVESVDAAQKNNHPALVSPRVDVQGKVVHLSNAGRLVIGFDGSFFDLTAEERALMNQLADMLQQHSAGVS